MLPVTILFAGKPALQEGPEENIKRKIYESRRMDVAVEPHRDTFPYRAVFILAMCLTVNGYTLMNLFPYVGMMVQHLMGLPTTNESGEYKRFDEPPLRGRLKHSYLELA